MPSSPEPFRESASGSPLNAAYPFPVVVLVMRYHRLGDPGYTACGIWMAGAHSQTVEEVERQTEGTGIGPCRRCFRDA